MTEHMIAANGAELCSGSFGRPADPAVLLIMGIGASMPRWELLPDGRRGRALRDPPRPPGHGTIMVIYGRSRPSPPPSASAAAEVGRLADA
jgi:hypothetical protein